MGSSEAVSEAASETTSKMFRKSSESPPWASDTCWQCGTDLIIPSQLTTFATGLDMPWVNTEKLCFWFKIYFSTTACHSKHNELGKCHAPRRLLVVWRHVRRMQAVFFSPERWNSNFFGPIHLLLRPTRRQKAAE